MHFPTGRRVNAPDRVDSPDRPISPDQMSAPDPVNAPHQRLYFLDPSMRLLPDVPPPAPPLPAEPAEALVRGNKARGVAPDFRTSTARYKREDDIPSAVFVRAFEALDGAADANASRSAAVSPPLPSPPLLVPTHSDRHRSNLATPPVYRE